MRTIKFRIWNGKDGFCTEGFVKSNLYNILDTNPEYVQQFTGLLDKQGKEIYEGDLLGSYEGEEMGWYCAGRVFYWEQDAKFILVDKEENATDDEYWENPQEWIAFEIIGNIYSNPELLTNN